MDIRIASYQPLNTASVTRFGATATAPASVVVSDSAANGPVPAVNQVRALPAQAPRAAANQPGQLIDFYV
jgi:hypothetical protein